MLHDFITSNRGELIRRCKEKVAKRPPPIAAGSEQVVPLFSKGPDQGVPLFLSQLVDTLRQEAVTEDTITPDPEKTPAPTSIGRGAALHGADLLSQGYSLDQVVHDYGDICQAITELGVERKVAVSTNEFRTLNRCLDNAIADAVTAYASGHNSSTSDKSAKATELNALSKERQLQLIDLSIQVLTTVRGGHVGLNGPTSAVLASSLLELRELIKQVQPEIAQALRVVPPPRN